MFNSDLSQNLSVLPEAIILLTAVLVILADTFFAYKDNSTRELSGFLTFIGIFAALVVLVMTWNLAPSRLAQDSLMIDPVSQFLKAMAVLCGLATVPMVASTKEIRIETRGEFYALLLLMLFSSMIIVSAQNLLAAYVAIQMCILSATLLTAFRARPKTSSEAGLKYFLHSQIVLAVFLFGMALLFFHTDSLYIPEIRAQLESRGTAAGFSLVTFSFLALCPLVLAWVFPFQMLAPDASQGAPTVFSGFILAVPFISGLSLLLKFCVQLFGVPQDGGWAPIPSVRWDLLFSILSALTISVGTLGSVRQSNVKRFLAYCAVAQVGYILLGMAVLDQRAIVAILSGVTSFGVALFGIFAVTHRIIESSQGESFESFRGLVWRDGLIGVAACIFLLSLAGLPPFAGFASRFELLGAVVHGKLYWLAGVVVLNWVIGLVAYGKLIKEIFYPIRQLEEFRGSANAARFVVIAMLVPTVILGVAWNTLHGALAESVSKLTW